MKSNEIETFNGFNPETFKFLLELEFNNEKSWFEQNKPDYLKFVVEPFKSLVRDMSSFMLSIDPGFETRAEIGKTISRIYRDVRFSKDKTPYKTSVWFTFRRVGRDWLFDPCFFFEITPHIYRYGMGFYTASKETLSRLRELIDENAPAFQEADRIYRGQNLFEMEGDRYKKLYAGQKTPELLEWYQRRNIYFMCTKKPEERLFSSTLADELKRDFDILVPLYKFLWKIKIEGETKS
jgi:uncharacterized protein (TIGR02453 family)